MEEKNIIQSKQANIKQTSKIIALIGLIVALGIAVIMWPEYIFSAVVTYSIGFGILPFVIIAIIFYTLATKVKLTVTDKRVYGTTAFGKRVDLPLDMISAVGIGMFKSIAISTTSGVIKFSFMENRDAIHNAISNLLVNRQNKPVAETAVKTELPQSNADELKKYKELLDSGVISQEEFDSKKKQLLGL